MPEATLLRKKYPVAGATVKGNIDLPDTLSQGNYFVTAFTAAIINYSDENFVYRKNLFVFNPVHSNLSKTSNPNPSAISLKFFPESGHLVDDLVTVVAFKAEDAFGKPVEVTGIIKADDGFTIPFKSFHDGIGKVAIRPRAGKIYTATINGSPLSYPLPSIQKSGINLKIQDEKGGKMFTLSRSKTDKESYQKITLVAQINNQVVYENEIDFEDYPSIKGHLLTENLSSGILHFTVFNKDGAPLAERLSFVDNKEYVTNVNLTALKKGTGKRQENSIEINFPDSLQRSFSVSVTDASGYSDKAKSTIISELLLTSDLKGKVFNAAWYFQTKNDSASQALDNLMLTHGWSRFNWKKIKETETTSKKLDEKYLIYISGIVKASNNTPVNGGQLNIYADSEDSATQNFQLNVNTQGKFIMDSMIFYGKTKIFYNYSSQGKTKPVTLVFDSTYSDNIRIFPLSAEDLSTANSIMLSPDEINSRYQNSKSSISTPKDIQSVTLKAKTSKKPIDIVNEKYTTGVFRQMGKVNLDNINQPPSNTSMSVIDYIKNSIRQVQLEGGRFVNPKTMSLGSGVKWTVAVFIDAVPAEVTNLRALRMDEIAMVKFYDPGFVGASSSGPGGAIAVFTKKDFIEAPKPEKMNYVEYNGYSITKEFYSPDYTSPDPKHDIADNRTTLYWNPSLYSDAENRSVKLNFFNNDFSKKFKVVVTGFSANGKLIHLEKTIE